MNPHHCVHKALGGPGRVAQPLSVPSDRVDVRHDQARVLQREDHDVAVRLGEDGLEDLSVKRREGCGV